MTEKVSDHYGGSGDLVRKIAEGLRFAGKNIDELKTTDLSSVDDLQYTRANREAFQQGLRALGYVEGHNIAVEYRYAKGKPERAIELAAGNNVPGKRSDTVNTVDCVQTFTALRIKTA